MKAPNPSGLCMCGCGGQTEVSTYTKRANDRVAGQHVRYLPDHWKSLPRPVTAAPRRVMAGGYVLVYVPKHPRSSNGCVYEHILVAERALRKPLPPKSPVHHFNEDRADNRPGNLVICQDHAYHMLLHRRLRALRACGNPNFVRCRRCRGWDDPARMYVESRRPGTAHHRECEREYWRSRRRSDVVVRPVKAVA